MTADLTLVSRLSQAEGGLAVVATTRADATVHASVVNAGVLDHPVTSAPVVGFVTRGGSRKHGHLQARPHATIVFRSGGQWVAVEGPVDLAGPEDPLDGMEPEALPPLLRAVFRAAGGRHDDWQEYDRTMAAERRLAVLVEPTRVYSNPVVRG